MMLVISNTSAQAVAEDAVVINEFTVNPTTGREYVELLVTAPTVDMRNWTLSDRSLTGTPGGSEGSITLPNQTYLSAVPQGTFIVIELTTPTANPSTLPEDLSLTDATPKRLIIKSTTTGVTTDGGVLDNATADNLVLFSGAFSASGNGIVDQVLVGNNTTSLFSGATWGDNNATTTSDNINAGSSVPSNSATRFVPTTATFPQGYQANDTGTVFATDANSYGTPGEQNTGIGTAIEDPRGSIRAHLDIVGPQPATYARVRLTTHAPGAARLDAYDLLGRHVTTLLDGTFSAGKAREVTFSGVPAGVYVLRATGAGFATSQTVVLH